MFGRFLFAYVGFVCWLYCFLVCLELTDGFVLYWLVGLDGFVWLDVLVILGGNVVLAGNDYLLHLRFVIAIWCFRLLFELALLNAFVFCW